MADPISGMAGHAALQQGLGQEKLQQQTGTGGRSFESVLQQQPQGGAQPQGGPEQPAGVSGADLERMRLDLEGRISRLPPGSPNVNALLPELIDTRTRLGMLRDVMDKSRSTSPGGMNLQGRFGQIESEWANVESVMRSNRDLSTTELLGLQARLYQVTQHVEVLSKVVDQVTGGIKTILNTNV